jgi:uncharacterized phage protein gp47/JayE
MSYGVTEEGFLKKSLTVIREEIQAELLDQISSELDLQDTSVLGQIEGIFSDKLREMWDVAEAVYRAFYPDSASGEALDQVASITGVVRLPQTKSTVTLDRIFLANGVTVAAGNIVRIGVNGPRFVTLASVTNSSGRTATFSVEAESEDYGPIQGYAETIDEIATAVAGWSAAAAVSGTEAETFSLDGKSLYLHVDEGALQTVSFSGGDPWTTAQAATEIENQTTDIDAYDDGGGYVRVASEIEGTGSAIQVDASAAATELGLPTGKIKGFNSEDADPGTEVETDPDFRLRREAALRSTGSATVEAIRAAVLLVDGVEQVFVIENVTLAPVDGIPGKAFETIVLGGTDQDIADEIWDEKPAGILAFGSTIVVVEDSMGFNHDIGFSRAQEIPLHLDYTLTTDPDVYPADGDNQVRAAVVAYAETLQIGDDAIALAFKGIPLHVAGVIDVTTFKIDTVDPPTGTTNITATFRQLFTVDTSDIDVTS